MYQTFQLVKPFAKIPARSLITAGAYFVRNRGCDYFGFLPTYRVLRARLYRSGPRATIPRATSDHAMTEEDNS